MKRMGSPAINPARFALWILLLLAAALSGCGSTGEFTAPKARAWDRWEAFDPASRVRVDHRSWDRFLATYVVRDQAGVNRVAYALVTPEHRRDLADYIDFLGEVPVSRLSRDEQFAYWVNLYNALTVKTVLDHYPIGSILDISISPGLFANGPWGKPMIAVEGQPISLDDIEHRILRPIWRDPRLHYLLSCAAVGCPNLMPGAITAMNEEPALILAALDFVNNPRAVRIDGDRLTVSSLYVWYRDDFGGSDAAVIGHLRRYAAPSLAEELGQFRRITAHDYDWALNDAR